MDKRAAIIATSVVVLPVVWFALTVLMFYFAGKMAGYIMIVISVLAFLWVAAYKTEVNRK